MTPPATPRPATKIRAPMIPYPIIVPAVTVASVPDAPGGPATPGDPAGPGDPGDPAGPAGPGGPAPAGHEKPADVILQTTVDPIIKLICAVAPISTVPDMPVLTSAVPAAMTTLPDPATLDALLVLIKMPPAAVPAPEPADNARPFRPATAVPAPVAIVILWLAESGTVS